MQANSTDCYKTFSEWNLLYVISKDLRLNQMCKIPPVLSGVRVARSVVLGVCFVDRCLSFFFWPLCCLFFFNWWILITYLVSFVHCVVCSSSMDSDYLFGIFWPLCCLFIFYGFWLPIWYLLAIVLFVHLLWILITYLQTLLTWPYHFTKRFVSLKLA